MEANCTSSLDQLHESNRSLKTEDDKWLNTTQASAYLGVSEASLWNMTSEGKIPYFKLGRRNRFRLSDLSELLLKNKRGTHYGN